MNELVSIFSPVYNITSRYPGVLERFLESIRNQTYTNIEVILVDDGSTDNSADICDRWAAMDNRFHVVRHGKNLTINKARETGFRHCTGPLVYNADPDDLLHPQAIEIQHDLLASHPDCSMVVGNLISYWDEPTDFVPIGKPKYEIADRPTAMRELFRYGNHTFWDKLYRRELLESIDWDVTIINDFHLTLQIWLNASKFIYLKDTTYYYIRREMSETLSGNCGKINVGKFDTLTMDWNRYIYEKHPEYYSDYLFRAYNFAVDGYNELADDETKNSFRMHLLALKNLTFRDYIKSDAPIYEKMAFGWLMHFPGHKPFISKLKSIIS